MTYGQLPKWFKNRLAKVIAHNDMKDEFVYAEKANENGLWSPLDLIIREYYNNGGDSSKGFLGLTRADCIRCYDYAVEHQDELHEFYSERGANNWGITLWNEYRLY